jgi:hypothetical protein
MGYANTINESTTSKKRQLSDKMTTYIVAKEREQRVEGE